MGAGGGSGRRPVAGAATRPDYSRAMSAWLPGSAPTATLRALRVEADGAVAEVVLTGPGKGNALGPDLFRELPQVFGELDADPQVRAVVLRGEGDQFSYGLDLPAMASTLALEGPALAGARRRFLDMIERLQAAVTSVELCAKPVVAAVSGWCIGGGVDLLAACDIAVASAEARFSVREVRVAIVADLGSLQRLPRLIGAAHARRLALTGEDIDASRAEHIGLVSEVLPDPVTARGAAHRLARQLASLSPLAVQGTKRILNETRDASLAEGLRHVALWNAAFLHSQDLTEALAAFAERRTADFTGQ